MKRIKVESSNLASVGYDLKTETLEIEFQNGGIYQYSGVSKNVYDGLMNAESKGKYFIQNIKDAGYSYTKMR